MPSTPPSLAVIGCGFIFRHIYAPVLETLADRARMIALVDPDTEAARSAAARFPGARAYADLDALLASEKPDAVLVLTPERLNAPVTLRLLDAGLPVYLEKPPSVALRELDELIRRETLAGLPVYSAFNRRHMPLLRDWRPPADLRKVRGILSRQRRPLENFPYTGSHLLDTAQYLAGSPFAETRVRFDTADGPARWTIGGRLENRAAVELVFIPDNDTRDETIALETSAGEWTVRLVTAHPSGLVEFRNNAGNLEHHRSGPPDLPQHTAEGFTAAMLDFLGRLSAGTLAQTPHRLARARPTVEVMERMLEARLQPA